MSNSIGLIKRPPEIDIRRGLHVKLMPDTHAVVRVMCVRRGISMQELVEELMQRITVDDPAVMKIVDELVKDKRQKNFKKLSHSDAESLFDIFELESPLK